MTKHTGIWLDTSKAIFVTLSGESETIEEVVSGIGNRIYHENESDKGSFSGSQHINHDAAFEERIKHETNHFMNAVLEKVKGHDAIYVFGPAEAKTVLKKHLESDRDLASKLRAVETADSMTLNQVVAHVRAFYNR